MPIEIAPYLGLNGKCREAMNFYQECFGGELHFITVAETPAAAQCPAGMQDQIMHSTLTNGPFVLMATDMSHPDMATKNAIMSMSLNFSAEEEINACYAKLVAGGKVLTKLEISFWGALFGVVEDRFGMVWLLTFDKNKQQ